MPKSERYAVMLFRRAFYFTCTLLILVLSATVYAEDKPEKNYAFAPIVISNPNIGSGVGATGMYFFDIGQRADGVPRSNIQAFGAYTNTDSLLAGLLSNLHFKQDSIRSKLGLFNARINNDYRDPLGGEVKFATNVLAAYGEARYRLWHDYFLGGQVLVSDVQYDPDTPRDAAYLERVGAKDVTAMGIGPVLSYDTRDNIHYPSSGTFVEIKGFYKPEAWGNENTYAVADAAVNHFIGLAERHILALRLYGRTGTDDTPYSDKSRLGQQSDLRGFKSGEISALTLVAGQAEYRWQFTERWGAVAFGGLSKLWDEDLEALITEDVYYSGGVGIRYMINTDQKINFRIDVAIGNDDNEGVYVGIREAF
jgi:outer membrane protein assembly factor BamA